MTNDHEKYLVKNYPDIFVKAITGKPFTKKELNDGMTFGFECDDGWFDLIKTLSNAIQEHVENHNNWNSDNQLRIRAVQVKEKFGGLRFYINGADDHVHGLINFAERLSFKICQRCGSNVNVKRTDSSWITYHCEKCRNEESRSRES